MVPNIFYGNKGTSRTGKSHLMSSKTLCSEGAGKMAFVVSYTDCHIVTGDKIRKCGYTLKR